MLVSLIMFTLALSGWLIAKRKLKDIKIKVDYPDYGMVSIINESENSVKDIRVTIREDFSYADKGFTTHSFAINELAAHDKFIASLVYVKDDVDIGGIDVWLACKRGKLHYRDTWSYAYPLVL